MAAGLLERSDLFADISARRPMEKENVLKMQATLRAARTDAWRRKRDPQKVILYRADQYMITDAMKRERKKTMMGGS